MRTREMALSLALVGQGKVVGSLANSEAEDREDNHGSLINKQKHV